MKLGNGRIKFKFKFIYESTNIIAIKYVYADSLEEAKTLFNEKYSDYLDVSILEINKIEEEK